MRHPGRLRPSSPRVLALLAAFSTLPACAGARLQVHASGAEVPLSFSASLPDEHGNVYVLGHGLEAISHADLASIKTMLTLSIPEGVALDTGLDTDENTALMLAAQAGREDLVRFLLSDEIAAILPEPVDLGVRDVRGRTAADIALAAGHPSIAALLSTRAAASPGSTPGTTPDPWGADP